jgi:ADP-heptose:LPS heptosyltransferase
MQFYRENYHNSRRWNGSEDISGKHVVVYFEQGLGDAIQFFRYLPVLRKKFVQTKFSLACDTSLHPLAWQFVSNKDWLVDKWKSPPEHDCHILSLSLPKLLFDPEVDFPYIRAESNDEIKQEGYKIGIAWEGNPNHSNNNERCCPLRYFSCLAGDNRKLFMIQKQIHGRELLSGSKQMEIFSTEINNFLDTARLIQSMDLVVSVDTSVLHLAGAMNKKAFALLSTPCDPRWNVRNWYPSITLFRKPTNMEWGSVLEEVAEEVRRHAPHGSA